MASSDDYGTCASGHVCIFAKPPRPGMVKTRLGAEIGEVVAAELADAFLRDTWYGISRLPWARPILATTEYAFEDTRRLSDAAVWLQGEGDLGERIEQIMRRALRLCPFAIAVGADTPGLPPRLFENARTALERADAVLGPCDDGGFYLLGLTRCNRGLFRGLPWSANDTFARTHARLCELGLSVEVLDRWFDVDRLEDLRRLRCLIDRGDISAPATAGVLSCLACAHVGEPL